MRAPAYSFPQWAVSYPGNTPGPPKCRNAHVRLRGLLRPLASVGSQGTGPCHVNDYIRGEVHDGVHRSVTSLPSNKSASPT